MMLRSAFMACVCSVLVACGGGSDDGTATPAFTFSSFEDTTFTITVVDGQGAPLRGVAVSVEDVYSSTLDENSDAYQVYLRGLTTTSGAFSGEVRLPTSTTEVDVVVHEVGFTGPWSDSAAQTALGFFGPSSRQTVTVSGSTMAIEVPLTAL